jgi:hypothetical protein
VTGHGPKAEVRFQAAANDFSLLHSVRTGSGACPTSYPIRAAEVFSPEVKRPNREADHLRPSSTEFKNGGAIPSLPDTSSWRGA